MAGEENQGHSDKMSNYFKERFEEGLPIEEMARRRGVGPERMKELDQTMIRRLRDGGADH